ncbi:nitroreductase family protein [Massilia pseudoviolaceinigra]|uniref:nitroreductase family protein n=1 Tax=Massilia pseudoviolaceinigra TaxID=3057165 RepID=UPI0027965E76|nr:nitroreductase family protein [Massilia sp. CCM 9206]MDQ1923117.1 nitroreductase family protein [Massilia sp. CCM 9206]
MNNSIKSLIEARISANNYDTSRPVSDLEITELVRLATLAPSAYNFQNWKFIAVRGGGAKARLKALSFGQQKVADAPVTFIVCGTLAAHEGLAEALQPSVEAGIVDKSVFDTWLLMASRSHLDNPQLQRDEAIRSASLAAMTLMLAAQGMGMSTGSIGGFEAEGVAREFGLAPTEIPVMLVTVGYATEGNWPQKPRKPLHKVLEFV